LRLVGHHLQLLLVKCTVWP